MTFEDNTLVRHTRMPSWGIGRILKIAEDVIWIEFSGAGLKKLKAEIAAQHLAVVDTAAAHPTAARPEPSRSSRVANVSSRSRADARCAHCDQLLKRSQHRDGGTMKSCPNCSMFEGEHVFYRYPEAFGTVGAGAAEAGRDQSDCRLCRSNAGLPHPGGISCGQIEDLT